MQSVLTHKNIKPVHVSSFIESVFNFPSAALESKQISHLMAVQFVMDQNEHQFHLEEGERCRHSRDMMASTVI